MIVLFLNFAVILLDPEIIRKRLFPSFFALHHTSRIHMPAPIMETRKLSLDVAAGKHSLTCKAIYVIMILTVTVVFFCFICV